MALSGAPAEQDGGADHDGGQCEADLAQVLALPQKDLRQESLGDAWTTSASLCEDY